jgi:hypothetical protein
MKDDKKTNSIKRRKDNKTLSQKSENGRGKKLIEDNKKEETEDQGSSI